MHTSDMHWSNNTITGSKLRAEALFQNCSIFYGLDHICNGAVWLLTSRCLSSIKKQLSFNSAPLKLGRSPPEF